MPSFASIEIKDLLLETRIGHFAPGEHVPDKHWLDMTLSIHPDLVLIEQDGMAHVFDYDPLVIEICRLAKAQHYETQERLLTRLANACAQYREIVSLEMVLRKAPILAGSESGSLGVRLHLDTDALDQRRLR